MKIGAQLYTVFPFTQTLEGLSESLKKVADIGYTTVQVSGTCAYEPEWLKAELDKNGLSCVITHVDVKALTDTVENTIARHNVFGCKHIGLSGYGFLTEPEKTPKEMYRELGAAARALRDAGKLFMYHNHHYEFGKIDGRIVIDELCELFAPDELGFTFDTYWAQISGCDPAAWLRKLKGRVPCIHLKDCAIGVNEVNEEKVVASRYAVLGEGNMNFDAIFKAAEDAGTEYMLVEQDDCYGEDPFACLKRSYDYLRSHGFQ